MPFLLTLSIDKHFFFSLFGLLCGCVCAHSSVRLSSSSARARLSLKPWLSTSLISGSLTAQSQLLGTSSATFSGTWSTRTRVCCPLGEHNLCVTFWDVQLTLKSVHDRMDIHYQAVVWVWQLWLLYNYYIRLLDLHELIVGMRGNGYALNNHLILDCFVKYV